MLINLIQLNAEDAFLKSLENPSQSAINRCVLHCAFSQTPLSFDGDSLLLLLKDVLRDQSGEIYLLTDKDILICWHGRPKEVMDTIVLTFWERYHNELQGYNRTDIFKFHDAQAQGEELRLLMLHKLKRPIPPAPIQEKTTTTQAVDSPPPQTSKIKPLFTEFQLQQLQSAIAKRSSRKEPEFLIVEDQDFSRKILAGLFERSFFHCHQAKDAKQAIQLYAENAPDIAFLDVELPDADGHSLAALFKQHDPKSFIVMVTGNNYTKDVETAKANKVQGFIAKPYNKQKIMGAVEKFIQMKRKEQL